MKLATFRRGGRTAAGAVIDSGMIDLNAAWPSLGLGGELPPRTVLDLIEVPGWLPDLRRRLDEVGPAALRPHVVPLDGLTLEAPVPNPGKLICVASNYIAHITESGREAPPPRHLITPWLFMKPSTSVIGAGQPIPIPPHGQAVDWEVELAAVIGRRGKYIPAEQALDHVAGYTIVNDISERRFKAPAGRPARDWDKYFDWLHGKWFDGFAPMGPWLVTADAIGDPQRLTLELRVNGRIRQQGTTADMIYPVAELIAFASTLMTLMPGDVIATGTPHGVGSASGEFLKPGDVVECALEGVGSLVNPVVAEDLAGGRAS